MFRTRWYNRGRVLSDEGYSVESGRDWLVYRRASRKMTVTVDQGSREINVFVSTANRWDDAPSSEVDESTKAAILNDIRRALEWQGLKVNLLP
jgi:hypothetical protein